MPQNPEITTSQAAMRKAQELKRDFLVEVTETEESKSPAVVFSTHEVSLAFGISQTIFKSLVERDGVFVIDIVGNSIVRQSLMNSFHKTHLATQVKF